MGDIVAAFCFVLFWGIFFGPVWGPCPNPGMSQEVYRRHFPRGISQEVFPRRYRYTGGMADPTNNHGDIVVLVIGSLFAPFLGSCWAHVGKLLQAFWL